MVLHFFVTGHRDHHANLVTTLSQALDAKYGTNNYSFQITDVLSAPEIAVAYDVFATPMLVRVLPTPKVKIIGRLATFEKLFAIIESWQNQEENQIIII